MTWTWTAVVVVVILISTAIFMLTGSMKAPTLLPEDSKITVAEVGKRIPVLFGTRLITNTNVVWYGDVSTEPRYASGGKK